VFAEADSVVDIKFPDGLVISTKLILLTPLLVKLCLDVCTRLDALCLPAVKSQLTVLPNMSCSARKADDSIRDDHGAKIFPLFGSADLHLKSAHLASPPSPLP
jgi:hypothetical protein